MCVTWRRLEPSVLRGHEQNALMRQTRARSGEKPLTGCHCSRTDASKRPSPVRQTREQRALGSRSNGTFCLKPTDDREQNDTLDEHEQTINTCHFIGLWKRQL